MPVLLKALFLYLTLQGVYQAAKWNGTKVAVKILDKESYSDPESMYLSETFSEFRLFSEYLFLHALPSIWKIPLCFLMMLI